EKESLLHPSSTLSPGIKCTCRKSSPHSLLGRGNVIFRFSRRIPALYCVRVVLNVQITSAVSPLTSPHQVVEPPPFAKAFAPATPLTLNPSIGRSISLWISRITPPLGPPHTACPIFHNTTSTGTTINVRHTQRPHRA